MTRMPESTLAPSIAREPCHKFIYVTTLIRGKRYGYLYKLDASTLKVLKRVRVHSDNDRAKHGGPHGLAQVGPHLVTGTYSDLHVYDSDLNKVRSFSHPFISGVHGMCADPDTGRVWVTSCNNDAVLCFETNGNLVEAHFLEEDQRLTEHFGLKQKHFSRSTDFRTMRLEYADQAFHVNHVCIHPDGVLVCLHKQGVIWNLSASEPYAVDLGKHIHDGQSRAGRIYVNDTGRTTLRVIDESTTESRQVMVRPPLPLFTKIAFKAHCHSVRAKQKLRRLAPFLKEPIKKSPYWLRGLAVLDEKTVITGLSPAALIYCDLSQGRITRTRFLSHDVGEAVFGILLSDQ